MKVGITGTPGTGKTTVSEGLNREVIDLKEFALKQELGEQQELFNIDMEKVRDFLPEDYWIEGHLTHKLNLDYCIVLRTRPEELEKRLEARGYSQRKIRENVEAEAMDLILSEACQKDFKVYEIDTTAKSPQQVVNEVIEAVNKKKERSGIVDWTDFLGL